MEQQDKIDKIIDIVSGVIQIPAEEWEFKKESGMIDYYVTSKNETGIMLYKWASDGGKPFLIISEIQFYDDRLIKFWYKLYDYTKAKKLVEENDKIENLHKTFMI